MILSPEREGDYGLIVVDMNGQGRNIKLLLLLLDFLDTQKKRGNLQ